MMLTLDEVGKELESTIVAARVLGYEIVQDGWSIYFTHANTGFYIRLDDEDYVLLAKFGGIFHLDTIDKLREKILELL